MLAVLRRYALASVILVGGFNTPAHAQGIEAAFIVGYGALTVGAINNLRSQRSLPNVEIGTRLEVKLHGYEYWFTTSRVSRVTADSLVVVSDRVEHVFARSEIDSVRVKTSNGRWAEGWVIGLVGGGAVGAVLAYQIVSNGSDEYFTPGEAAAFGGVVLGVTGSLVGAGVGLLLPSRWVTLTDSKTYRVSIVPTIARPGLVARIQF